MTTRFLAALLGTVTLASPAFAQAPEPPQSGVEDIIVTAQRRAERLLDVPVSVVATSGRKLTDLNLTQATDLQFVTPGFALGDANTPRGAGFRIRGIGTNVFADGVEQSVGTVVDGIPLARAGQGLADLVDIERVEVLRGPQGLLFGRNAAAGLVNIVTLKPSDELSLIANASYGTNNDARIGASVSTPLGSTVGVRLSAYVNGQDGFVTNVRTRDLRNNRNEYGFRGAVRFTPTETLEIIVRGDTSKRSNACCTWTVRQFASAATDPRPGQVFLRSLTGPLASGPEALEVASGALNTNEITNRGVSGEINLSLGDFTLTSLTGYRTWKQEDNNDADLSPLNVLDRNFGSNNLNQVSQELRLTSPVGQTVDFVAGLFYFRSRNTGFSQQVGRFTNGLANAGAAGISVPLAPGVVLPPTALIGRDVTQVNTVEDFAGFANATINVTPEIAILAGGRVTRATVNLDYRRIGTPGANSFNFILGGQAAPLAYTAENGVTNFSWRVGAQWQPTENHNLYASVARGFKGPGWGSTLDLSIPAGTTPQDFTRVNPEIPTAYEIGYKTSLFDRKLTVSLAAFQTDFKDFQAQVVDQLPGAAIGSFRITNAGKLRTRGFEAEVSARPLPELTLDLGLAFNDAKFIEFVGASCPRLGVLVTTVGAACGPLVAGGPNSNRFDASGQAAPNAPRWTANAGFRYELPLADVRPYIQSNVYWRSATTFGIYPANIPNPTTQPAYAVVNGALGITGSEGRWQAAIFARNLFNQNFVTSIFDLPFDSAGGLGQFVTRDAQRTLGFQINLRF